MTPPDGSLKACGGLQQPESLTLSQHHPRFQVVPYTSEIHVKSLSLLC